jgi:hypothetical protein
LVLNKAQILGTTSDFDMTPAVVEDLNKILGSVVIPPDGVSPMAMAQQSQGGVTPTAAGGASAPAKPAAAKPPPATSPSSQQRHP